MTRKRPITVDIATARRHAQLGGMSWAAWMQRIRVADLEAALLLAAGTDEQVVTLPASTPDPEPEIEDSPAVPDRRAAPSRPARMHTHTPSRPAVDLPAPPTPRLLAPRAAPPAPRFTRAERVQVLATITRHHPISRTLLLNWHTGMRVGTLDAILASLTDDTLITLTDGRYSPAPG